MTEQSYEKLLNIKTTGEQKNTVQSFHYYPQKEREIQIILYYGSEDYVHYLQNHPSFKWREEIMIPGFYQQNPFERFLVYELG